MTGLYVKVSYIFSYTIKIMLLCANQINCNSLSENIQSTSTYPVQKCVQNNEIIFL